MGKRYGLEIRSAGEADAPGLADLLRAAGHDVPAAEVARRLDGLARNRGAVLVALEWGPPSGIVAVHWYGTLSAPQPIAQIDALLVDPDARRRGIGRVLVKAAAHAARQAGCGRLRLLAGPDETALRAFCAATGFTAEAEGFVRGLRKGAPGGDA